MLVFDNGWVVNHMAQFPGQDTLRQRKTPLSFTPAPSLLSAHSTLLRNERSTAAISLVRNGQLLA